MLTSSRRVMGPIFVNSLATRIVAWTISGLIIGVNGCVLAPCWQGASVPCEALFSDHQTGCQLQLPGHSWCVLMVLVHVFAFRRKDCTKL